MRDQGKHRKKSKNGKYKKKLGDVLDTLFDVKTEVPDLERSFYDDQCSGRNMFIVPVDVEETEKLLEIEITEAKKDERERTMEERKQREAEGKTLRLKKVSWDKVELGDDGFEGKAGGGEQ